jgi:hypothetical protein
MAGSAKCPKHAWQLSCTQFASYADVIRRHCGQMLARVPSIDVYSIFAWSTGDSACRPDNRKRCIDAITSISVNKVPERGQTAMQRTELSSHLSQTLLCLMTCFTHHKSHAINDVALPGPGCMASETNRPLEVGYVWSISSGSVRITAISGVCKDFWCTTKIGLQHSHSHRAGLHGGR